MATIPITYTASSIRVSDDMGELSNPCPGLAILGAEASGLPVLWDLDQASGKPLLFYARLTHGQEKLLSRMIYSAYVHNFSRVVSYLILTHRPDYYAQELAETSEHCLGIVSSDNCQLVGEALNKVCDLIYHRSQGNVPPLPRLILAIDGLDYMARGGSFDFISLLYLIEYGHLNGVHTVITVAEEYAEHLSDMLCKIPNWIVGNCKKFIPIDATLTPRQVGQIPDRWLVRFGGRWISFALLEKEQINSIM